MKEINQFKFKNYGLLLGSSRKSWIDKIDKSNSNEKDRWIISQLILLSKRRRYI